MIIFLFFLFVVDRVLKLYFVNYGSYVLNPGVAFGIIGANPGLVQITHIFLTCVLVLYLYKIDSNIQVKCSILAVILGSISNLLDRFMYNGVVDYIDVWIFPKFNIADLMVVFGALLLIIFELNEYYKKNKSRGTS